MELFFPSLLIILFSLLVILVWLLRLILLRPFTIEMMVRRVADLGFLDGSFKSQSFIDSLSSLSSSIYFLELYQGTFCGLPLLWISEVEIRALSVPFQFSLVGFFLIRHPFLDVIHKFFFSLKLNSNISVLLLYQIHILIKLYADLDIVEFIAIVPIWCTTIS